MELETLRSDMIAAMKAKDKARKEAISSLISAAKKVAIDEGCRDDIKPELVDRVILKELKTVKEQIDTCPASREGTASALKVTPAFASFATVYSVPATSSTNTFCASSGVSM